MYILNERNKENKRKKDEYIRNLGRQNTPNTSDDMYYHDVVGSLFPQTVTGRKDKKDIHILTHRGRHANVIKNGEKYKIKSSKNKPDNYMERRTTDAFNTDAAKFPIVNNIYHVNGTIYRDGGKKSKDEDGLDWEDYTKTSGRNREAVEAYISKHNSEQVEKAKYNAPSAQAARKAKKRNIKIGAGIAAGALTASAIAIGGKAIYDRKKYKDYLKNHPKSKLTFKEWKSLKKSNNLNESLNTLSLLESYNDGSIEYYQAYYEELDRLYLEEYFDTLVELMD